MPLSIASDGQGNYYLAGGEEPTATYGFKYFNGAQGFGRAINSVGINDRNVSAICVCCCTRVLRNSFKVFVNN